MDLHHPVPESTPGNGSDGQTGIHASEERSELERLRRRLARQEVLLAESRHRMRNVLALLRAIVGRTARAGVSAEVYARDLETRIAALERLEAVLAADASVDLETTIGAAVAACGGEVGRETMLAGPPVSLSGRVAESLALAVQELAINAAKYGALASEGGRIDVTWTVRREPQGESLVLEWSETGVVVAPPDRRGFGSELIEEAVPYDLSGTGRLVFRPTGILCQIVVPLGEACA